MVLVLTQHPNPCPAQLGLTLGLKTCGRYNIYDRPLLWSFTAAVKSCRIWSNKWREGFHTGTFRGAGRSAPLTFAINDTVCGVGSILPGLAELGVGSNTRAQIKT